MSVISGGCCGSGAAITAPSLTYVGYKFPDVYVSQQVHVFSDIAVGTPPLRPNRRWLVMMISYGGNTTHTISADGVSGSQVASASTTGGSGLVKYHYALTVEIPEGTTVDVTVTTAANTSWAAEVFVLNNVDCSAALDVSADGGTTNTSQSIDCLAGGALLAYGQVAGGTSSPTNCEFRNITTILETLQLRSGECRSGQISGADVTALDIDLLVTYAQAAQSFGFAVSFPPY